MYSKVTQLSSSFGVISFWPFIQFMRFSWQVYSGGLPFPEELVWGHKRGCQRIRWLDGITHATDMNLGKPREMVRDRVAWLAAVHGSLRVGHNWATEHVYIGLAKKFVQVCPYNVIEKPKRTFWPTQFFFPSSFSITGYHELLNILQLTGILSTAFYAPNLHIHKSDM